jgi:hypothetical protein
MFIGNFQLKGSLLDKLLKVLLVFFEFSYIFKDNGKSLTALIKNKGNQFEFKKIPLSIDLNTIYVAVFSSACCFLNKGYIIVG